MGIHYFPCQFVYWRKIKNHENFKRRLLHEIENNRSEFKEHSLVNSGLSSFSLNEHENDFNKRLLKENPDIIKEVVWDSICELVRELNSRKGFDTINIGYSRIVKSWMSIYSKNSSVQIHCHSVFNKEDDVPGFFDNFVVVYILNDKGKKNSTEFVQFYGQLPTTSAKLEHKFYTEDVNDIGEGCVMIFPSNLYHGVNTVESDDRIVFTFNISSTFK